MITFGILGNHIVSEKSSRKLDLLQAYMSVLQLAVQSIILHTGSYYMDRPVHKLMEICYSRSLLLSLSILVMEMGPYNCFSPLHQPFQDLGFIILIFPPQQPQENHQ